MPKRVRDDRSPSTAPVVAGASMTEADRATSIDLITQIQDHLNGLCSMFFNFAGALQRDAGPVCVADEPEPEAGTNRPKHNIVEMAAQIAEASKHLDELIGNLPSISRSDRQQIQAIANLKEESDRQGDLLRQAVAAAESRVALVQDLFAGLTEKHLDFTGD